MNISVKGLLKQMKNQVEAAERAAGSNEQEVREYIRALHSLCELVLEEEAEGKPVSSSKPSMDFQDHLHLMEHGSRPKPPQPASQTSKTIEGTKLEEDDANGDSLFDF
ncbi:YwdI family protein [Bacillus tianshenii]|nr:YwdI family protein [Bacillus tianshenii]